MVRRASDIGNGREITYHHNYYKNVNARLPLQRGGWIHVYNNLYDGISDSGINVRTGGYALIEKNWFQNAANPVTCRYDTANCGKWDLRGNNATKAADNATYNISWTDAGERRHQRHATGPRRVHSRRPWATRTTRSARSA